MAVARGSTVAGLAAWYLCLIRPQGTLGQGVNATQPLCMPLECCPESLPMGLGRGGNAQIRGPASVTHEGIAKWMVEMKSMRTACQKAIGFDGSAFEVEELKWTQTSYIAPQMHPYDRFFFDPALGNGTGGAGYTVKKWLGDLNKRYGGIDRALIWPTYTQIGIDDRSQWELILSMPGGVEGIRAVVDQLHAAGVKVLWPYHPWDHSTHGQERNNITDYRSMAELLKATNADGFNGDTMQHIPRGFYDAATEIYKPIAMEAEGGITSTWDLNYITIGWGEGWNAHEPGAVDNIPNVDKAKWLSNGKAQINWCDRWSGNKGVAEWNPLAKSKNAELQVSFFNGLGFETWENVWGTWNGISERDGEEIRRVATLLRFFGGLGFLQSAGWVPHSPEVLQMSAGVFGSAFPGGEGKAKVGDMLYFLVNRKKNAHQAPQLDISALPNTHKFYDCWNGIELQPSPRRELEFTIEGNGYGCVFATATPASLDEATPEPTEAELRSEAPPAPADLGALLRTMAVLTRRPISTFSPAFHYLNQTMLRVNERTNPLRPAESVKVGETYVPGGDFRFVAQGVELEGAHDTGVDVQYPWETYPHREHDHDMYIGAMIVDTHPVTNSQYAEYLKASHYYPKDSGNWLKQNFEGSEPRKGWENKPVTYVSLDDARAYCAFYNKRLPHVYEWQYFAQSGDGRLYPWGNEEDWSVTPAVNNNFTNPGPEEVGQYQGGASPFGVQDLIRSVWQYTSEFEDIHTRSVILRGGSNYHPYRGAECRWIENDDTSPRNFGPHTPGSDHGTPACWNVSNNQYYEFRYVNDNVPGSFDPVTGKNLSHPMGGSHWYFPPAYRLDTYNKYYLMSGSYERAGTVGFRCIADAVDDCGTQGKLCAAQAQPPDEVKLSETSATDWMVFGTENGVVRKAGLNKTIISAVQPVGNATGSTCGWPGCGTANISFVDGYVPGTAKGVTVKGLSRNGAGFLGPDGGFTFAVAAPAAGKKATVDVFVGGLVDAQGVLTAAVADETVTVRVAKHASVVSLRYADGPLSVRYVAEEGTVCPITELCVLPLEKTASTHPKQSAIHLPTDALDWVHFGPTVAAGAMFDTSKEKGTFLIDRKKDGLHVLNPQNGTGGNLTYSMLHGNVTSATSFAWSDGEPTASTTFAGSQFFTRGSLKMTIPHVNKPRPWRRKLTLYMGATNVTAQLTVTSPGFAPVTKIIDATHEYGVPANLDGDVWLREQLSKDMCATIFFEGELTVTYEGIGGDTNPLESGISWQAAVLEEVNNVSRPGGLTGQGGVSLQAIKVSMQP